ncbi:hypothetical protein [Vreelandella alkaliphila]|uniref:hypothetical protein n=1 Tax=Vreelandella alkaliphila TaxID=272774 RepID=UPI00232CF7C2|nr:hypothetical protein [Halomonas alkaliphila]
MEMPFIIWTLRRSGGTNLGAALFKASSFSGIQHEPFNGDRVFGYIVQQWKKDKNDDLLRKNIREVLISKPLIKHCFEIMPDALNLILAEESQALGYQHLFLYREYATDRLLSLNYSLQTGVWGKGHASSVSVNKEVFNSEIDVDHLIQHERQCRKKIRLIYDTLLHMEAQPLVLTFENLYRGSYEYSKVLTKHTFSLLGLEREMPSDEKLFTMLRGGGQGTKSKYTSFLNANELIARSKLLGAVGLRKKQEINVNYLRNEKHNIDFRVWQPMQGVLDDEIIISGLFYNNKQDYDYKLKLVKASEEFYLHSSLPSPRFSESYPDSSAASFARFISPSFKKSPFQVYCISGVDKVLLCHADVGGQ